MARSTRCSPRAEDRRTACARVAGRAVVGATVGRVIGHLEPARLDAVAARLHPHFLFNALHSVTALIRTGEPNAAVRAVVALSALLRAALESDGEAQVPLARELDWVRNYLDIE